MTTGFSSVPRTIWEATIDVANVPTATSLEVSVTGVPGAEPSMAFVVVCPALEANLNIGNAYSSAVGTVKFRVTNPTVGDVNPASHAYKILGF